MQIVSIPLHVPLAWHFLVLEPLRINPGLQENCTTFGNAVKPPNKLPFLGTVNGPQSTAVETKTRFTFSKTSYKDIAGLSFECAVLNYVKESSLLETVIFVEELVDGLRFYLCTRSHYHSKTHLPDNALLLTHVK